LVAQNVDLVRGTPDRHLKQRRRFRLGSSLLALTLLPMAVLGSSRLWAPAFQPVPEPASAARPVARAVSSPPPSSFLPAPRPIDPSVFPLAVHRIAIDAGHGGKSGGTRAPSGLTEQEVTLDIARRLKRHLEGASFEVVMTRDQDREVSLKDRARIANQARSDLFLSIHLNWIAGGNTRGVETYYLGPTDDPELSRLAALENRESGYSVADFRRLLDGVYADAREGSSRRFAESINGSLFRSLTSVDHGIANRGVKTAPF